MAETMPGPGLRWGAIGASWIASDFVIPAIRESGGEVVAVFSADADRAAAYSARNGIPSAYADLDAFLADPAIEAVYISTTNQLHYEQVLAAAAAGKAILCEKPMTTGLAEAKAMVATCERAGVVFGVNHHMRNAPTLRAMHRLLHEGAIGRPLAVRIFHSILLPDFLRTWRVSRPEAGGGAILDLTSHDADNLRFLLEDEVQDVVAIASSQRLSEGAVEDAVMGVMRFAGGVVVSFHDAFTIGNAPTGLEIHGTEGSLFGHEVLRQGPMGEVTLRRGDEETLVDVGVRDNLYVRGLLQFTEAVRGHGRPVVTGEDGLRSVAVALAVAESARTGQRVTVDYGDDG
jgi:1,5-anhydro-D-fructose reductase (1,5-anhydro-D-mannitol-forming)